VRIDKKSRLFSNLTLEELKNITITTQSQVWDDEGWLESLPFVCVSCSSQGAKYTMYFNQQQETQNSINSLVNSGLPQALKFGGDTYFEVDHYEKGIKDNGWARFKWRVWVTPHN
jgi:hypothetical protein